MQTGLVIKAVSGLFYVKYNDIVYDCRASSKLKRFKNQIITGDYVKFDVDQKYIYEICEREHQLIRPKLANVNNVLLVFSAVEPEMNYGLLDRMLLVMEMNKLNTEIIVTKMDLLTDLEKLKESLKYYQKIGYNIYYSDTDMQDLIDNITKNKYVFTGQSGVGKSTLINKLLPDLNLETNEISKALGRGKHTTREVTFYEFKDSYIIDTPGFSALDLPLTVEEVRDNYPDFVELSKECKFSNCYHLNEPKCAVVEKLGTNPSFDLRYKNYTKIINDIKESR